MNNKILSTANITMAISQQVLNTFLLFILAYGLDPKFEKPIVWIVLGGFFIWTSIHIIKRFNFHTELYNHKSNIFKFKNPFILWFVLIFFPKNKIKISTFTGEYSYFYKNNQNYIVQVNSPSIVDRLFDILILIFSLIIMSILYMQISKLNIIKYGLFIIFGFAFTIIFIEKILTMWCYLKTSYKYKENVYVSILMSDKSKLGKIAFNKIVINPKVLDYSENIRKYIIEHENGHLKSLDYIKEFFEAIFIYLLGIVYCYLQVVNKQMAPLVFIPIVGSFIFHVFLVIHIELKADEYAARQLGVNLCIDALNELSLNFGVNYSLEEMSFVNSFLKLIGIFKGGISIQNRIEHLKAIDSN